MKEHERNLLAAELMVSMAVREMRMAGAHAAIAELREDTAADFGHIMQELEGISRDLRAYLNDEG